MSDTAGNLQTAPGGRFVIQKIYVKDVSFETPNSPQVFMEKWEPEVSLQINNSAAVLSEGVHEVTLAVTVTAKLTGKVAYLIEVQQAGIFNATGFSASDMGAILGSYCPNILFPFVREVISDVVTKGGFPQLLLAPVNFDALYAQHVQQSSSQQVAH
jgi:preprotein translocase subunit SecB